MLLAMPYPRRIDHPAVIATARRMLEARGPADLTMRALARELDVRAPSLYAYVSSRDDLLSQLMVAGLEDLGLRIAAAARAEPASPAARLTRIADAYIAFAEENPRVFGLLFENAPQELRPPPAFAAEMAAPVVEAVAALVGPARAPYMAQTFWSLVHGYVVLNLARQFTLNADPRAAFDEGLQTLLEGVLAAANTTA